MLMLNNYENILFLSNYMKYRSLSFGVIFISSFLSEIKLIFTLNVSAAKSLFNSLYKQVSSALNN